MELKALRKKMGFMFITGLEQENVDWQIKLT